VLYLFESISVYHDQHHKCDHQVFLIFKGLFPIVGCALSLCVLSLCALCLEPLCPRTYTMKFPIGAPGLGAELPNEIRVLKCVGVFNLESRKGNTRPWSI
jgi:hypothetical protein